MNLSELANLVKVSEYLKNLVNTSGLNRFSRNDEVALKKKLAELESKFVSEVLALDLVPTAATIQNAIKEAKEKMLVSDKESTASISSTKPLVSEKLTKTKKEKASEVTQPTPVVEEELKREEVQTELSAIAPSSATTVNQPYTEDESLAAMLAAEKQKVAAKKRKAS